MIDLPRITDPSAVAQMTSIAVSAAASFAARACAAIELDPEHRSEIAVAECLAMVRCSDDLSNILDLSKAARARIAADRLDVFWAIVGRVQQ